MTILIYPYKLGSRSAKAIKTALREGGHKCFTMGDKEPKNRRSLVVNWGNSKLPFAVGTVPYLINPPMSTGTLTNKLRFFKHVGEEILVPPWTTSPSEAMGWKKKLYARYKLEASGGEGIVVYDPEKDTDFPVNAPLYTLAVPKAREYRVHMARPFRDVEQVGFNPLLVQRKVFKKGHQGLEAPKDWDVRNHDNGFIYIVNDKVPVPPKVLEACKTFMEKHFSTLHFAALDVIYSDKKDQAWILEGNTAPGLEGGTIKVYADYFQSIHEEIHG